MSGQDGRDERGKIMIFKWVMGHLLSCKDVSHLVSQMNERKLGPLDRGLLRFHLAICDACNRFERQMRFLREAMRQYRE